MVGFIHNGSEITTWLGHSFKTKHTKSRPTFLRYNVFFKFQAADNSISTKKLELQANTLKLTFFSCTFERTYLAIYFTKECFLSIC